MSLMDKHFKILPVDEDDIPVLGDMLLRSKLQLSVNRLLWKDWPNETAQRAQYTSAIEGGFKDPGRDKYKVVDSANGKILGLMVMAKKKAVDTSTHDHASIESQLEQLPDAVNKDVCEDVFRAVAEVEGCWEQQDRIDVVFIVVEPAYRRKGIGTALMQLCLDKSKETGLPVVACAEPAAVRFFDSLDFIRTRHGFMDLAKFAPPYSGYGAFRLTGMMFMRESSTS